MGESDRPLDAWALLLCCVPLHHAAAPPLQPREWRRLVALLEGADLGPGALCAGVPAALARADAGLAERVERLLKRIPAAAAAVESYAEGGIQVVTRYDEGFPLRLERKLGPRAPLYLYAAGNPALAQERTVAVVGSREVDEGGAEFAAEIGRRCAGEGIVVVSGAARGVDRIAMNAALEAGGATVGVLADSLERTLRQPGTREWVENGQLLLLTPYHPAEPFSGRNARARNRLIYGLGEFSVVVASAREQGGTWGGATEALEYGWGPLFVRDDADAPEGNHALVERGALPCPTVAQWGESSLWAALEAAAPTAGLPTAQPALDFTG